MSNDIVDNAQTDVDGFLLDGSEWSESVAFELAAAAGIERLSGQHWAVIKALREGYNPEEPNLLPLLPEICKTLSLPQGCVTGLFGDPLIAWQIAGLPKAGIDMAAYMPGSQ